MKLGGWTPARLVLGLGLILFGVQLARTYIAYGPLALAAARFPFPLDYSEGPLLDQAVRLARLENIYPASFDTPPYTLAATPPLFQVTQAPLTRLFGPAFWYGRLTALLGAGTAALLLGLLLWNLTHDASASCAGALIFVTFPYVVTAAVMARGDTLALALSLAGLYVLARGPAEQPVTRATLWSGGLLFTAAIYAIPSHGLAALGAALAWLIASRKHRAAVELAAISLGSALAMGLLLSLMTRGGFWRNLSFIIGGPIAWEAVVGQWAGLYLNAGYLLIAALAYAIVDPLGERSRAWPLAVAYLAGASLSSVAAEQFVGSGAGLLSLAAALGLGAGALLAWSGERLWLRAGLLLALALQAGQMGAWASADHLPRLDQKLAQARETERLDALVAEAPGPVLADEFMGLLPLHGRRIEFQPLEFRHLAAAGRWDSGGIVAGIERQAFAMILLYQPRLGPGLAVRWAPEVREAIYAHYETHTTLADTLVYLPRPAPTQAAP